MTFSPTPLERAFALARTGTYPGIAGIRSQLHAEGYETRQLEGPILLKQLRALCEAAQAGLAAEQARPAAEPAGG